MRNHIYTAVILETKVKTWSVTSQGQVVPAIKEKVEAFIQILGRGFYDAITNAKKIFGVRFIKMLPLD